MSYGIMLYLWQTLFPFFAVLFFMPFYIKLAMRAGFADFPRDSRRMHARPVVTSSGILFLFSLIPLFLCAKDKSQPVLYALALSSAMSAVGFVDDRRAMPASLKLFFEAVCAFAAAFIMGFSGPLQLIFAVTLVVFITNAVNLTDGIDGLCSAESCVCLFALSLLGLPVLPLLGGLAAFAFFNRPPARVFMGDCGSLFVGFFISVCFLGAVKDRGAACIPFVLMTLAYPVTDTVFAFSRRLLSGQSPFAADKKHLHHRLVNSGLSVGASVNIIFLFSILFSACGIMFLSASTALGVLLLLSCLLFAVLAALAVMKHAARTQ